MTETLQEYCDSRGVRMRVDREEGVIHGVKILGLQSRNRRCYLPEALVQAARLYEDAKVNVNHPKGNPAAPRDYQDRIGMVRNVTARPNEGLFADFHFNPKHILAEQLIWDAEHAPENVGFSHNVEAKTVRQGDQIVVEAITRVQSVDLVADPATTRGLYESAGENDEEREAEEKTEERTEERDSPVFVDHRDHAVHGAPTVPAKIETVPVVATVEELRRAYPELVEQLCRELIDEQTRLKAEVERLTVLESALKTNAIQKTLTGPCSRDQNIVRNPAAMDAKLFAEAIT